MQRPVPQIPHCCRTQTDAVTKSVAFEFRQMGYACAMAWILFLLILGLTWLATRATRKHVFYADS